MTKIVIEPVAEPAGIVNVPSLFDGTAIKSSLLVAFSRAKPVFFSSVVL